MPTLSTLMLWTMALASHAPPNGARAVAAQIQAHAQTVSRHIRSSMESVGSPVNLLSAKSARSRAPQTLLRTPALNASQAIFYHQVDSVQNVTRLPSAKSAVLRIHVHPALWDTWQLAADVKIVHLDVQPVRKMPPTSNQLASVSFLDLGSPSTEISPQLPVTLDVAFVLPIIPPSASNAETGTT